ncbi:ABC transporter ATP-binding protein [Arvimicrobium flavum]|uniref:ABC transporter ATP-binding protein n=1 Tax=Arvimicrobium flavum TaxID=3393320 RepID=UPI0030842D00
MSAAPLLSVKDLSVDFRTRSGAVAVLDRVSFDVEPGEIVGVVGESGSGKSVTASAIMGILDKAAEITSGEILFEGRNLLAMGERERDGWRGGEASIIFQNPRTALNPIRTAGEQIGDVIARHVPAAAAAIRARVLDALRQVRIPDPETRARAYPFELSSGMCQRIGIAMALSCSPKLLIADEPTTSLDVTTQAVIMDLIRDLARERNLGALIITHDLALAAEYCDRIVVMHAGHVVETAGVAELFAHPRHPYTTKLMRSVPSMADDLCELQAIAGSMPDLSRNDLPPCRFAERCERRLPACDAAPLTLEPAGPFHLVACRNPL